MTVAVCLARSGSKGVVNKNVRLIGGLPLCAHAVKAALLSNHIRTVVFGSDSLEYFEIVQRALIDAHVDTDKLKFIKRSKQLSSGSVSSWTSCEEVLNQVGCHAGTFVLLGTNIPTISVGLLDSYIRRVVDVGSTNALSVRPVDYPLENTFSASARGLFEPHALSGSCLRQHAARFYRPDGMFYTRSAESVGRGESFPSAGTLLVELAYDNYVNVDTYSDLEYARWLFGE